MPEPTPPESDSVEAARDELLDFIDRLPAHEHMSGRVYFNDCKACLAVERRVAAETAVVERERTLPMFRCDCGAPATWRGEWSDREMYVCDDHRDLVRLAHDSDHEYDRSGITWRGANGGYEYEPAAALAQTTDGTP